MASICLNSLPYPPSSSSSSSSRKSPLTNYCTASSSSSELISDYSTKLKGTSNSKPILVSGDPPTFVSAPARRIVAVGDLHGDLDQARTALEIAGVLSCDEEDLWIGGETVLVQLGDILDRGEDEIAILSLLRSLDMQAKAQGGAVFQVNGNHETINVEGDFRYVDSGGFDECADFLEHLEAYEYNWENAFVSWISVSKQRKENQKLSQKSWGPWNLVKRQKGVIARSVLFKPGGPLARELAKHPVILRVNDWIFCHGGLLPHHVSYGIERMNWEVSQWMKGLNDNDSNESFPFIATRGYDSVVWNRLYSRDAFQMEDDYQTEQILSILEETLQRSGAKGMVVGHTPQTEGVNCKYNCSVWRIDVGMSSGVLNSRPEVLEIRNDKARVLKSRRDSVVELQVADFT
ncbi:Calcineurin-like metallo-phosphoesterase superfamily protein [Euphorbia peplus]|nr:Calcineurin-like metallo-phosphoesterase superfamily protein [Euphorbia peplus]